MNLLKNNYSSILNSSVYGLEHSIVRVNMKNNTKQSHTLTQNIFFMKNANVRLKKSRSLHSGPNQSL